jgi:hypothetical protein
MTAPTSALAPDFTTRADRVAHKIFRIDTNKVKPSRRAAESALQRSMLISALRCTLTYVIFPFVFPALGLVSSIGPWIGLPIGVIALVCDVMAMRRFFAAGHRYRWPFAIIVTGIMCLVSVLVVQDIIALLN